MLLGKNYDVRKTKSVAQQLLVKLNGPSMKRKVYSNILAAPIENIGFCKMA